MNNLLFGFILGIIFFMDIFLLILLYSKLNYHNPDIEMFGCALGN